MCETRSCFLVLLSFRVVNVINVFVVPTCMRLRVWYCFLLSYSDDIYTGSDTWVVQFLSILADIPNDTLNKTLNLMANGKVPDPDS